MLDWLFIRVRVFLIVLYKSFFFISDSKWGISFPYAKLTNSMERIGYLLTQINYTHSW